MMSVKPSSWANRQTSSRPSSLLPGFLPELPVNLRCLPLAWLLGLAAILVSGSLLSGSVAPLSAQPGGHSAPQSAWDVLVSEGIASPDEQGLDRVVLELLSPESARLWASGTAPSDLQTLEGESLRALLTRLGVGTELLSGSPAGGGGWSTGGRYDLVGGVAFSGGDSLLGSSRFELRGGVITGLARILFFSQLEAGHTDDWTAQIR